jgi:uncharacterized protein YjgD (DUF1641 family)
MIRIKEVISAGDIKDFVQLPFSIYRNNKFWIPPIRKEEIKLINSETNPAYEFCDAKFWTAWNDKKCVGRVGAIINHNYNDKIGKKMGRVSRIEFVDDKEVSKALFGIAENWLKEKDMDAVHGPLGFTNFDNQGLLIEGFNYLPSIASVMHQPYYQTHFENNGFEKEIDWVEFRLTIDEVPEKAQRLAEIIKTRNKLEIVRLSKKSELKMYMNDVFHLLNKAFAELPFVAPFSDEMISFSASKYLEILQPKFVVLIKKESQLVGFIVGLPSLSKAMQKANGSIFPFGILPIMKALKNPEVVDLLLTGVDPQYQKLGLPAILINELQKTLIESGVKYVETTGMFETNLKGATHWKNYDHIQHKRRRCFIKEL